MDGNQFQSLSEAYKSIYQSSEDLQEAGGYLGFKVGGGEKSVTVGGSAGGFRGSITAGTKQGKDTDAAAKAAVTNAVSDAQKNLKSDTDSKNVAAAPKTSQTAIAKTNKKSEAGKLGGELRMSSGGATTAGPTVASKVSVPQEKTVRFATGSFSGSAGGQSKPTTPTRPTVKTPTPTDPGRKPEGPKMDGGKGPDMGRSPEAPKMDFKREEPKMDFPKREDFPKRDPDMFKTRTEEYIDEAEGSYGKTPKATAAYGKLANERRSKPASEYSERGEKKSKVSSAEKHMNRSRRTAADHGGKKSTNPAHHSYQRDKMTQSDRDHLRGQSEYGHMGYDPDFDGGPSAPGSKPKGKKLERQKKTGVSAESYNAYEVVFEYLLDEGFASTEESADKIILNMSEEWFENIMELTRYAKETGKSFRTKKPTSTGGKYSGSDVNSQAMRSVLASMGAGRAGVAGRGKKKDRGGPTPGPANPPAAKVAKRRAAAQHAQDMMHSRYD